MKCSCSLNGTNYKIIGLCDNKFNKKINEFTDKSWTQITLSKKLEIPPNKHPIKSILKIHLDIKITSTKIIKTPYSDTTNIEGLKLTGNLLLLSGNVCHNIVYISESFYNTLHSIKLTIPFSAYIVIDENTDLNVDSYCIYSCVEDVFITPINQRFINENVTLFLFAHKIAQASIPEPDPPPVPEKIFPTIFTFKTQDSDQEMAKIEFNKTDLKLIVSSSGLPYSSIPNEIAFEFKLIATDEKTIKLSGVIQSNQSGDNFKNTLNAKIFSIGDFIDLTYLNSSKSLLINYPNTDDTYTMSPTINTERFVITSNGITPILSPNKITIKSKSNNEVLNIQFVKTRRLFIVSLNKTIPNPSSTDPYLTFIFKNKSGKNIINASLKANEDGTSFKSKINFQKFSYEENSLTLIYNDKNKVEILNYPSQGSIYIPVEDFNIFLIKENQLIDISFKTKIKILNDSNEEMSNIYFIKPFSINSNNITIVCTSTNVQSTNITYPNRTYFEYLQYFYLAPNIVQSIATNNTSLSFSNSLDGTLINTSISSIPQLNFNILRLSNMLNNKIILSNYKNKIEHKIGEEPEFLEIKQDSILPHSLNYNKIRLKNKDNSTVLFIYFDNLSSNYVYMEPYSTGITNTDSDYFSFKITKSNEPDRLTKRTILKGDTGDAIKVGLQPYNVFRTFFIEDTLTLEYSDKSLVEIFDFPFTTPPYNPTDSSQEFKITEKGLVSLRLLNTLITFRGSSNNEIANIQFNAPEKKLIVTSSGLTANLLFNNENYFTFILKSPNGSIKEEVSVKGNENANNFKAILNDKPFVYNDIIIIRGIENDKNLISNYPNLNKTTNLFLEEDSFIITPDGLLPKYNYINNIITFNNTSNNLLAMIRFNTSLKNFSIGSTRNISTTKSSDNEYFSLLLKDVNGNIKQEVSVKENESAINFSNLLNNQPFEYKDTLTLRYQKRNKVLLSNYPTDGESYTPAVNTEDFIININEIKPITPPKPIDILPNSFIFNAYSSNIEIAKISFDKANLKLIVTSNGNSYNNDNVQIAFKFELLSYDEITLENFATIGGNENANNFKNILLGRAFEIGDLIKLQFDSALNLYLSDYPSIGVNFFMINNHYQGFKITQNGIVPYILPNLIILNNSNNQKVVSIQFDILYKILSIISYNNTANTGSVNYFITTLYSSDGIIQKQIGNISGNANGLTFKNKFNNLKFEYGDVIKLEYEDSSMIDITNFPTSTSPIYHPLRRESWFKITQNGLELTQPLPVVDKLPNSFLFKTYDTEENMASIEFDKNNKKFIVTSYSNNCNGISKLPVFNLKLISLGIILKNITIYGLENADNFRDSLNGTNFEYNDLIILSFSPKPKVTLTNYPSQNKTYNMISHINQSFKITTNGISPNIIPNSIVLNNLFDDPVAIIQFDIYHKNFLVLSSGELTELGGIDYFKMTLYASDGRTEKNSYSIPGYGIADIFRDAILDLKFEFKDIIKLECEDPNMITITNFPTSSSPTYHPTNSTTWFKITQIGLEIITPPSL